MTPGDRASRAETLAAALTRGTRYLARRGVPSAARNARFLLAHALGTDLAGLVRRPDEALGEEEARRFGALLCARGRRQPLQYLLGSWEFYGFEIEVSPAALIPRPETEGLVERVLCETTDGARLAVDVGTGTGAIAIALARERPDLRVIAVDLSRAALELAARNVAKHGLGDRIELVRGSFLAPMKEDPRRGSVDVVVSNPPYVSDLGFSDLPPEVREHEPRAALVSGPSGLEAFSAIVPEAAEVLAAGGLLAFEVGDGQSAAVSGFIAGDGRYLTAEIWPDLAGTPRVVTARRTAARA
jgi:release factor glutamine methyltransferase